MGPMNEVKYFFGKEADAVIAGESAFHKTCPINPTPTPGTPAKAAGPIVGPARSTGLVLDSIPWP